MQEERLTIEGGFAQTFELSAGDQVRIINIEASQVVDVWALCQAGFEEFLSTQHTRSCLEKLTLAPG